MAKRKFHLKQADTAGKRWRELSFRSYVDDGRSMCLSNPIVKSVIGDEIDYGKLFAYLFRRFGYPNRGWDDYKELVTYYLTTPHPGMVLEITPYVGGTSAISLRFLVETSTSYAIEAYAQRHRNEWKVRSLDWAEAQGLPDWMQEWVRIYNTEYRAAFPDVPLAENWRQTVNFYFPLGEEGTNAYELTNRVVQFREKLHADFSEIEPYPPFYYRPSNLAECNDDDPIKPFVAAAIDALKDLRTPVGVRDQAIDVFGEVEFGRSNAKCAASAGYPSGALGNAAPQEFAELHTLILKLGKSNVKRGIAKVMDAIGTPSETNEKINP